MAITLPTAPIKAERFSPKILILYSLPKVGKTFQLTQLPECLIADCEGGAEGYDCLRVSINSTKDLLELCQLLEAEGGKRYNLHKAEYDSGKRSKSELYMYKFIAIDTVDKLEEYAEVSATYKYKNGRLNANKKFEEKGYESVVELPEGGGYYYLRNEFLDLVARIALYTPHLILTCHVKDKRLPSKTGEIVTVIDLSLTGKLGSMLCAKADAIGYMSRSEAKETKGQLMVSFETYESAVMGARQPYLAGQKFAFDWKRIYPDEFGLKVDTNGELAAATV